MVKKRSVLNSMLLLMNLPVITFAPWMSNIVAIFQDFEVKRIPFRLLSVFSSFFARFREFHFLKIVAPNLSELPLLFFSLTFSKEACYVFFEKKFWIFHLHSFFAKKFWKPLNLFTSSVFRVFRKKLFLKCVFYPQFLITRVRPWRNHRKELHRSMFPVKKIGAKNFR